MDVVGPYRINSSGNQYCLMVGCYFLKWLECFPIPSQKAMTVARKLVYEIVARYGAVRELHSNQGTNFGSKVVLEVCRLFGIHKTRTTQYHPRSNGLIERSFRPLGRCLKAACQETRQEWDELLPLILMSYRATPQASKGVTPNMMMLGRQTRLPIQAMYGTPLGPDEEEQTVSKYVAMLQDRLRAAYRHAREGLQRAVCIRGTTMMTKSRGENTRPESWYGSTISRWDETGGWNYSSHGTARCLSRRSSIGDEWSYAGSRSSRSL